WRRFGPHYFRPSCATCAECVSLRVLVSDFSPTRSQRRAAKKWQGLRRIVDQPRVDAKRLALYSKWHSEREQTRHWAKSELTAESYALEFAFPHPAAREVAFYDRARLVGIGLCDQTPHALSAVYFFYDPEYESLGVANIVGLIDDARRLALSHVY